MVSNLMSRTIIHFSSSFYKGFFAYGHPINCSHSHSFSFSLETATFSRGDWGEAWQGCSGLGCSPVVAGPGTSLSCVLLEPLQAGSEQRVWASSWFGSLGLQLLTYLPALNCCHVSVKNPSLTSGSISLCAYYFVKYCTTISHLMSQS